jgi:hypothetical protein
MKCRRYRWEIPCARLWYLISNVAGEVFLAVPSKNRGWPNRSLKSPDSHPDRPVFEHDTWNHQTRRKQHEIVPTRNRESFAGTEQITNQNSNSRFSYHEETAWRKIKCFGGRGGSTGSRKAWFSSVSFSSFCHEIILYSGMNIWSVGGFERG